MQSYPGGTFNLDFQQGIPKPYFEYYVTLLGQDKVVQKLHFEGKETMIPPPTLTKVYNEQQPSQPETRLHIDISKFVPTVRAQLGSIVHTRSSDKGSDCNCGFWMAHQDEYAWLRNVLSISTIKVLLGKDYDQSRGAEDRDYKI